MRRLGVQLDFLGAETLPYIRDSATSRAAAESAKPSAALMRRKVRDAICAAKDGLTDEEVCALTGIAPNTARPRRIELVTACVVRDSGKTRPTKSGRQATVWVASEGR